MVNSSSPITLKKLTSDRLEKKITFAKLYKEYDWIIAVGTYYDNLEEYIRAANAKTREERAVALSFVALSGLVLLLAAALLYLWAERVYYDRATEPLKTEVETDLLTGARSRRSALKALSTGFLDFKNHGGLYHLLVLDLDDFKQVNDTHGHEVGDRVLQRVVDSIKQVIRTEDQIYRWGGEEFILFVRGIPEDNLHYFVDKVLKAVEGSTCKKEALEIKTTISIGAATFKNSDQGYEDVLKRADDALYESKRTGKNKGTIC